MANSVLRGLFLSATCGLVLVAAGTGCGGDEPEVKCTAENVTGTSYKYSTKSLLLPMSSGSMTFSSDLDGDGKTENALKTLVSAVKTAGMGNLDLQASINESVKKGEVVILSEVQTPSLTDASCVGLTLALAKAPAMGAPPPTFDGTDMFQVGDINNIKLYGKIVGGKLTTTLSKDQTAANEQKIQLKLPLGADSFLPLIIHGVQISGNLATEGSQPVITSAVINGAVSKKDIDSDIVPTVAKLITDMIHNDPMGSTAKTIITVFEVMSNEATKTKCMVAEKCCATNPMTCEILPAEVLASPVGGVLSPDVQVFNDSDQWAPVAGGKARNGMSVGLGFSSIKATY